MISVISAHLHSFIISRSLPLSIVWPCKYSLFASILTCDFLQFVTVKGHLSIIREASSRSGSGSLLNSKQHILSTYCLLLQNDSVLSVRSLIECPSRDWDCFHSSSDLSIIAYSYTTSSSFTQKRVGCKCK